MPIYRRMMVFIDGENLVLRFQDILRQSNLPKNDVSHLNDVYVWHPQTISASQNEIIRANIYLSATGDEDKINEIAESVKRLSFVKDNHSSLPNNLFPYVFKKKNKNQKAKGVDIKMCVDILTHAFYDNYDTAFIVGGDGDYLPVIEEIIRRGKQVHLAAFSSGLNPNLLKMVDKFIELDNIYFD